MEIFYFAHWCVLGTVVVVVSKQNMAEMAFYRLLSQKLSGILIRKLP